jgi:SAM-dependent methyltransferase
MRTDWNARASEDAYYYAACGRRRQEEGEFFQTAAEVLAWLDEEIRYLDAPPETCRALEIGCGPGRLMRPLSRRFAEIHGVDVSDAMIELARRNLTGNPHAYLRVTSGSDLAPFSDGYFDFVYSYAVFQHIPSCDVVFQYLRETVRVLKTDGILTFQFNGLAQPTGRTNTWEGVDIRAETLVALARESQCQVLALDRAASRYMWTTWRKRAPGSRPLSMHTSIRQVRSGSAIGHVTADGGATIAVTVDRLSRDCDLTDLSASVGGKWATVCVIHPTSADGSSELSIVLPEPPATGRVSLELRWRGQPLCEPHSVEVLQAARVGPAVVALTDGVNYLAGRQIVSRVVSVHLDNVTEPGALRATVDGHGAKCGPPKCVDARTGYYMLNVFLNGAIVAGQHRLQLYQGTQKLPQEPFKVGILQAGDAFRGVPSQARLLEIAADGSCIAAGENLIADPSRLPFSDGQFAGIAALGGTRPWGELRRVLKKDGALYVETPTGGRTDPEALIREVEICTGLTFRWRRELARNLAPGRPSAETPARSLAGYAKALISVALRGVDRLLGTRLARGGVGFYFGTVWSPPDLQPRLNGCVRCGSVYSSAQLSDSGTLTSRFPLVLYLCPGCGAPNVFTIDPPD